MGKNASFNSEIYIFFIQDFIRFGLELSNLNSYQHTIFYNLRREHLQSLFYLSFFYMLCATLSITAFSQKGSKKQEFLHGVIN
uniref:Putative ovule protein n=1 Tax=Solanum chacoense TaxID=4108 RepID=A0A0V0HTQ4_SOLCH